ncbi:MAG: cytochrome P450 [Anaerolineales bacterium]
MPSSIPTLSGESGLAVLRRMFRERSILGGLAAMRAALGNIFRIALPNFHPIFLAGPEANRHLLVTHRHDFLWRTENDPVTRLLRRGLLVTDGAEHDRLRAEMEPFLQRGPSTRHIPAFWCATRHVTQTWQDGKRYDMLIEMRKIALLILMDTLFGVDMRPDLAQMWTPILKSIAYISPGPWLVFKNAPRPGYARPLKELDDYLYSLIQTRRADPPSPGRRGAGGEGKRPDLLTHLIHLGLDDDIIRDQLLTMLIAGHDTSTALLAWALYLLGKHPDALTRAAAEAASLPLNTPPTSDELAQLPYLDQVIKETLRLYPPIHVGNRRAAGEMTLCGYPIPEGTRVMYSIYLAHRHPDHWPDPDAFRPERFARDARDTPPPLTYVPFGGGPRNCIGAGFAQVEARVVLGYILQTFNLQLLTQHVHEHMGATLEPRPGVVMRVRRRAPRKSV